MARFLSRATERISKFISSFPSGSPVPIDAGPDGKKVEPRSAIQLSEEERLRSCATRFQDDLDWLLADRRRQKLTDLYLFAVGECLRGGADQWWRRAVSYDRISDLQEGVTSLKDFCLQHVLYDAGNVPAFRRVYESLEEDGFLEGDDLGRFLLKLVQYLDGTLQSLRQPMGRLGGDARSAGPMRLLSKLLPRRAAQAPAVVSVIIPDAMALANFLEFCLPSLAGEGGLRSLTRARAVSLLIFARRWDLRLIKRRLKAKKLRCAIICTPIPEELAVLAGGGRQAEWLLGSLQCLHLMEAKRRSADFHSVNPNAVYDAAFFEGVVRLGELGKSAVLLATFSASPDVMRPELAPFRHDDALAISAIDLTSAGLRAAAPSSTVTAVRDVGHIGSTSHLQLMWETKDCLQIHTTQYEIVFLARTALNVLPQRFFLKASTEIDRIVGDARPYFVTAKDHIAMVRLSSVNVIFDAHRMNFADFGTLVSRSTRDGQAEYFKQPVSLAISRAADLQRPWREASEIAAERDIVFGSLDEQRESLEPTAGQALTALNVLHQYEVSEYGLENMAATIDEGRRILDIARTRNVEIDDDALKELIRTSMNFDHIDNAIALAKNGKTGTAFIHEFLVEMMKLRATNEARARQLRATFSNRSFAVIGSIVWGERFVDKFLNYCLPSLLAVGNIPALAQEKMVVHSIVTTEADRDRMLAHPALARLREYAEVVFTCFPVEWLKAREQSGYNFYHFYGLLDHQSVFLAMALEADLYLLPIDCVYSGESLKHFSRYLEKEADCCSIGAIESDELQLCAWLDDGARGRTAEVLDLPSVELLQAACARPDTYFRSLTMSADNVAFCRHPRELVWPLADGLAMHSIFMHPLAVSARLVSRPFHPAHENVDFALLPRLLQGDGRLKVIEDAREAVIGHFGAPATRGEYLDRGFSVRNFLEVHRYDYAAHRRFFATRQFFPCRDLPYVPSGDYEADLALIQSALGRYRFRVEPA